MDCNPQGSGVSRKFADTALKVLHMEDQFMALRGKVILSMSLLCALVGAVISSQTASAHPLATNSGPAYHAVGHAWNQTTTVEAFGKAKKVVTISYTPMTSSSSASASSPFAVVGGGGGGGCATASAGVNMYSYAGVQVSHFELSQYWCWNGTDITSLPQPYVNAWGLFPTYVAGYGSNSYYLASNQGYSVGHATFVFGVPTPWGPIGSSYTNTCQISTWGSGGWSYHC